MTPYSVPFGLIKGKYRQQVKDIECTCNCMPLISLTNTYTSIIPKLKTLWG